MSKCSLDEAQRNQGLFKTWGLGIRIIFVFANKNLDYAALHQGYKKQRRQNSYK